ncbi:F-BAR and double SH3 domains protein 2-like isoform X1 [Carcharodon carcharias]|uniref:F-BAR and double SH3 domains protein 2-like isoform X1 n=1 Tax=Carcharodon carcharias TaxID=13397 RepID=UPI001B7ED730|nr:F-BAR and double SH3 domains protein 2-like isoform X1 [Carcharodon carcharias]
MQPPPRKGRVSQEVKISFSEQLCKVQNKQQQEAELLEDIRSFSKQRAAIEKEYGQALQRLAGQYLKKDWNRGKPDTNDNRTTSAVWRSTIEATMQLGLARTTAAEYYRTVNVEAAKTVRSAKDLRLKKCSEQLVRIQAELIEAVKEVNKAKKKYWQMQRIAEIAREKAAEAEAKSRKSEFGIFHSKTSLQKLSAKLSARLSECNHRVTEARNEYLLSLAAVTSHQDHYLQTDLPIVMKNLDGDVYNKLQEYFVLISKTEIDACQSGQECFRSVLESSSKISRDCDLQSFLQENPVFTEPSAFPFQPAGSDKVCQLEIQPGNRGRESSLDKEARKWATKLANNHKVIAHGERVLRNLEQRRKLLSEEEASSIESKMDEIKESIRKAETSKLKAASRLNLLREAGLEVDRWLVSTMNQASEELERERKLSEARVSNGGMTPEFDELDFTDFEEFDDNNEIFDENSESNQVSSARVYPVLCKVLYSYQATQSDELTIILEEQLEVIEDGDMEDWVKARNKSGQIGYVPEKYLQFPCGNSLSSRISAVTSSDITSYSSSSSSAEQELMGSSGLEKAADGACLARALYDYEGQSAEELCFPEGGLIKILHTGERGVDDGFWEGEFNGRVGVFPSLLVELLVGEGTDLELEPVLDPTLLSPPPFSPPAPDSGLMAFHSAGSTQQERLQVSPNSVSGVQKEESQIQEPIAEMPAGRLRPIRTAPPPPSSSPVSQQDEEFLV